MAAENTKREVVAPAREWLTKQELLNALELSERVLDKLIRDGKFPHGTLWDGKEKRWRWWVVLWFTLQKDVQPLLYTGPLEGDDGEDEPKTRK